MKTLLSAGISGGSPEPHPLASLRAASVLSRPSAAQPVECPKCGKRSVVARSHNTFDCLNCNFHRELPPVANRTRLLGQNALHTSPRSHSRLFSTETSRLPLDFHDEMTEVPGSQPWIFALIAVIFGILLL